MTHVGFVGVGRMGTPMVARLVGAGHQVTVLGRTEEKRTAIAELGATAVTTVTDTVDGADVVNLDLGEVCGVAPRHDKLPTNWTVLSQVIFGLKRAPGEGPRPSTCVSGESSTVGS